MDALKALIDKGPDKKYYKVKAVVLERYMDIQTARRIMCMWRDIAVALGFEEKQWHQVAACYRRVDAQVKAGILTPGGVVESEAKIKDPKFTRLPSKRIPVGDGEAIQQEVEAKYGPDFFKP